MAWDWGNAAIGGVAGGFAGDLLKYNDPSKAANRYMDQIPDQLHQYYSPYINRGNRAGRRLEDQYGSLLGDPGGKLNEIGGGYQQSPGFQFAMQQALQGAGNAAAAGGMAGSPEHEQQSMQLATNLANQDYNNWIKNALGLYGEGLGGEENMYGIGAKAGMGMGDNMANMLQNRAQLAYAGEAGRNTHNMGLLNAGASAIGSFLGR